MTDPIVCPQCHGRGWEPFGSYDLQCQCCYGRGSVGGPDDPQDNPRPRPTRQPPVWEHKAWRDTALTGTLACRYCLGMGQVTHYNKDRRTMVSSACPACGTGDSKRSA